jgi:hypothetical protein
VTFLEKFADDSNLGGAAPRRGVALLATREEADMCLTMLEQARAGWSQWPDSAFLGSVSVGARRYAAITELVGGG